MVLPLTIHVEDKRDFQCICLTFPNFQRKLYHGKIIDHWKSNSIAIGTQGRIVAETERPAIVQHFLVPAVHAGHWYCSVASAPLIGNTNSPACGIGLNKRQRIAIMSA